MVSFDTQFWTGLGIALGLLSLLFAAITRHGTTARVFAVLLLLIAVACPRWGQSPAMVVTDDTVLWIVVDVSRSMSTRDVGSSRLDRAKAIALDWLAVDRPVRVAVVAFAGGATLVSPPTLDLPFARSAIERLSVDSALPGGSNLDSVLRLIVSDQRRVHQTVLLLSDGGHSNDGWSEFGRAAKAARWFLVAVGIGDPAAKHPIPWEDGFLQQSGKIVQTSLAEERLRALAAESAGIYVPARTGAVDVASVLADRVHPEIAERTAPGRKRDQYQWFAAVALLALALQIWRAANGNRVFGARRIAEQGPSRARAIGRHET